jgi:hypothetical protein
MAAMGIGEIGGQDVSKTKATGQSIARSHEGNTFAARSADFSFDIPPPRGGLRSLSVAADRIATKFRALSGLLS